MQNSTKLAIGAGVFAVLGIAAFFYFKGKQLKSTLVQCPNNPDKFFDTTIQYDKDPCKKLISRVSVPEPDIYDPRSERPDPIDFMI